MKLSLQDELIREKVIKAIRAFFDERDFREVITPVLNKAVPLEENIFAFETDWKTSTEIERYYLPTSPERNLKILLSQGIGNCYSIGHSFRNLEASGSLHSPEFLMLEWYREDADYRKIMQDTEELVSFVVKSVNGLIGKWSHSGNKLTEISLEQLFKERAGIDLEEACDGYNLLAIAEAKGYSVESATWSQVFDQIFLNEIEPHLPKEPVFLVDFPASISPLCAPQADKPYLAERFEVYVDSIELGNGNTENLDADAVSQELYRVSQIRSCESGVSLPVDTEFLEALRILQKTGKSYAGIGLGVDRLVKILGILS